MKHNLTTPEIRLKAAELRWRVLEMNYRNSAGHIGGAMSAADILSSLFFGVMDHSLDQIESCDINRDRFVLSKGHISDGYYAVLALAGYFPEEELATYSLYKSRLGGHPTTHVPGVELCTGALGHGLSASVGMTKAAKMDKTDSRVFTLLGDGELAEGSVWEAAMAAGHFKLDNLTAIIDRNGLQIGGTTEQVMGLENLAAKWSAFGWDTVEVDGHNIAQLVELFESPNNSGKPRAVIANTVKGKGISFMENSVKWHHGIPSDDEYIKAAGELMAELKTASEALGVEAPDYPVTLKPAKPKADGPKYIPARQAVTDMLTERAYKDNRIVALTSDARGSASMGAFVSAHPDKFIEVGIAEQNELGIAAGLALSGKVPFVCAPACFVSSRSYEQAKVDLAYSQTNVKLLAVSGGASYAELGQTHHSLQDIALMRSLPGMDVVIPADASSARKLAEQAIDRHGPMYMRVGRAATPDVYTPEQLSGLEYGKASVLREGDDGVIIASGVMVRNSLLAAEELSREGLSLKVIDMHTVKPMDTAAVLEAARSFGSIITVEEHVEAGGLGSAVLELLSQDKIPVKMISFGDVNAVCGSANEILAHHGLDASSIASEVQKWLKR